MKHLASLNVHRILNYMFMCISHCFCLFAALVFLAGCIRCESAVAVGLCRIWGCCVGAFANMRRRNVDPAGSQPRTRRRCSSQFPDGPETLEEAMDWPRYIIDSLRQGEDGSQDGSLLTRVLMNLQQQNVVVTDYSGWECPQWGVHEMKIAFEEILKWEKAMLSQSFTFARACDFGPTQNRVLVAISNQCHGSNLCVHSNMIDRLPRKARRHIKRELPPPGAWVEARRAAYAELAQWLLDNRKWVFPADAKAGCSVHGKECFANGIMWVPELQRDAPDRPSVWNIAGLTCHAWSAEGKGEGLAHESALYHGIWHAERIALAEALQEDGLQTKTNKQK